MNTTRKTIEAMRNTRTDKLFVLLESADAARKVKVINPLGDVLDVSEVIFDQDVEIIEESQFTSSFTPEQLTSLGKYDEQSRLQQEARRAARSVRSESLGDSPVRRSTAATTRRASSAGANAGSGRISATWKADKLTFYKHRIEPLKPKDLFAIEIDQLGDFVISKADFQRVFNNVIMSSDYRGGGIFAYSALPEEALPFLRKK